MPAGVNIIKCVCVGGGGGGGGRFSQLVICDLRK